MMPQRGSPAMQSAEAQVGPLRNEATLEADDMCTNAVPAVTTGDFFSDAAAAPAVGDSGPSASRDDDSDAGGFEDHQEGSMLRSQLEKWFLLTKNVVVKSH